MVGAHRHQPVEFGEREGGVRVAQGVALGENLLGSCRSSTVVGVQEFTEESVRPLRAEEVEGAIFTPIFAWRIGLEYGGGEGLEAGAQRVHGVATVRQLGSLRGAAAPEEPQVSSFSRGGTPGDEGSERLARSVSEGWGVIVGKLDEELCSLSVEDFPIGEQQISEQGRIGA